MAWVRLAITLTILIALMLAPAVQADADSKLQTQFDLRLRFESDYDSRRPDGSFRDDRARFRIRARAALSYRANKRLSFGLRLRTGSLDSHQSPHVTLVDFDDNPRGDAELGFDRWFARIDHGDVWAWAGRGQLPFWKQNEMFWDDDVTPLGIAAGATFDLRESWRLELRGGHFTPPVGLRDFSGRLSTLQARLERRGFTAALGLLDIDADPDDSDAGRLLRGNGRRDYALWILSLQTHLELAGLPLQLGLDVVHNGEGYGSETVTPASVPARDERDGVVLSARLGDLSTPGDWRFTYTFAEIEALAVNASYAEDDWLRWGSATQTRGSDFQGHELRVAHQLTHSLRLVGRVFTVNSLTGPEDGKRFRLDLDFRF